MHPATHNRLVGGINLHYLSRGQIRRLKLAIRDGLPGDNLRDNYRSLRARLPEIMDAYRTYDSKYITAWTPKELIQYRPPRRKKLEPTLSVRRKEPEPKPVAPAAVKPAKDTRQQALRKLERELEIRRRTAELEKGEWPSQAELGPQYESRQIPGLGRVWASPAAYIRDHRPIKGQIEPHVLVAVHVPSGEIITDDVSDREFILVETGWRSADTITCKRRGRQLLLEGELGSETTLALFQNSGAAALLLEAASLNA
jgi:hypothetical protein